VIQIVFSGDLMNRKVFYFSLLSIAMTGCSSVSNKQASGDFDYASQLDISEIITPEGLDAPKKSNEFYIEDNINNQGPIGKNVDVRAPSLVLPIAASSRVESNSEQAKIWFDQVLDDKDIELFVYQAITEQLKSDGVELNTIDDQDKVFESLWYNNATESGFWLFEEIDSTESMRFRYQLEKKPHGRSVALTVTLIDFMKSDNEGDTKSINPIDKSRFEMSMLNKIIGQVDYQYRLLKLENRLMRANQQIVSLGVNEQNEPVYIVEIESDLLWSNMPIFFENHGFTVSDLNETKKIYYVDFIKPDISFWDHLWSDSLPELELEESAYQFILTPNSTNDEQTYVTILDASGELLSEQSLQKLFPSIEPGLSFRSVD
jgi:outer membrane protein assembly factor BamC